MADRDVANEEVKGLARYVPTTLSKAILLLLPGTTWLFFLQIREHSEWLLSQSLSPLEQTLTAALASTALAWGLILILFIDMTLAINQSKHRRIAQYSNQHPHMSLRWLFQNSTSIHWLSIGLVCASFFALGYYVPHP